MFVIKQGPRYNGFWLVPILIAPENYNLGGYQLVPMYKLDGHVWVALSCLIGWINNIQNQSKINIFILCNSNNNNKHNNSNNSSNINNIVVKISF